jgi:Uma2 family endonuclease
MPRTAFNGSGEPWGKFGIGLYGGIVAAHHQASAWGETKGGETKRIRSRIHRSLIRLAATGRTCYPLPMSVSTLISVEEYLSTLYRPDCDLVDGVLMERNVGQKDHSKLQGEVFAWFRARRRMLRLSAFVEQRVNVGPGRFRVPDICVVTLPEPDEQVFSAPTYICIEILSPDDSFPRLQNRLDDYIAKGTENVWVLDPGSRRGWAVSREGHFEALDGVLRTRDGKIDLPIADLFPEDPK